MKTINIYRKKEVVGQTQVSDEDYVDLNQYRWGVQRGKNTDYAKRGKSVEGRILHIFMHRVVLERKLGRLLLSGEFTDHIDHNGLNNQRDNIRVASKSQNEMNKHLSIDSSSGCKGVCWYKERKKWRSCIRFEGKQIHLGYFDNKELASQTYQTKAKKLFGEFYCEK
ncbi:hypothetical protein [Methanosarcina virus MetMV]|nr:hypothetical protein [Methanosarcina virus MetMV]